MFSLRLLDSVQSALANRAGRRIGPLLQSQFLLKLGKLLHGHLLLFIQHLFNALTLFNIVHEHALDAVLERDCAGVTGPASTSQLEQDLAIDETPELNVSTVFLDGGSDAGFKQLLDHADDLAVVLVVRETVFLAAFVGPRGSARADDGLAGCDGLCDQAEDLGLDVRPGYGGVLADGDVVGSVED